MVQAARDDLSAVLPPAPVPAGAAPGGRPAAAGAAHLGYLDGWRGLAIVLLLVGHFFPVPGINFGAVGVSLFFVLSGLLMGQLLFVKKVPLPLFYRRRIARIFPALFVMLAAVTAAYAAAGAPIAWPELLHAALFFNNYTAGISRQGMPFGHIWSLSVEEHAYIALSLVALWSRRTGAGAAAPVALAAAASAAIGVFYWTRFSGAELHFGWWLHSEVSAYGIFISALLLLVLRRRALPRLAWIGWIASPALLGAGLVLHWWSVPLPVRTIAGVGLFALAVNLLGQAPAPVKALLSLRPLRQAGTWSYSIYLWQQPFYLAQHRAGVPAWLALALGVGAGIASFYLVEQPARAWLNARWGRARG
jgi:peptidoglycan/LPS O-acetylase OafA/YrhL